VNLITRARLSRLTGVTTALALAATLTPAAAYGAAPARTALLAAAVTPATLQEKAAAIIALELEPEPALTGLKDCDLAIALWQRLDAKPFRDEVRAAAVAAFSAPETLEDDDATACTLFIRTEIFQAKSRDLAIEQRVKEQQRLERELKQQAALTIGIVADPELLALSIKEFVWQIHERATGAEVKAAAKKAYNGADTDRVTFLSAEIVTAHDADRLKQIEEEAKNDAALKQKLIEDAARRRALAVLLVEATAGMLAASDRDFITYIWENADEGSEVRGVAEKAVLSREPADWNRYIHTGIHEANEEDRRIALQKKYQADLKEGEAVLAKATTDKFVNLANAARKALAGTPTELDEFVRRGQYELDLITGFETGEVPLDWSSSAVRAGAFHNVNGCSLALTASSKAAVTKARASIAAAEARAKAAEAAAKAADTEAEKKAAATRVKAAAAQLARANKELAAATVEAARCAAMKPENAVVKEKAFAGTNAIRYFGVDHNATTSSAYFRALNLSRISVKPTTKLTYRIYPEGNGAVSHVVAHNSTCVAVDLTFSGGANLRDSGATDQSGNRAHPAHQCGKLKADTWNEVVVPLGAKFNGKAVTALNIGYDQPGNTGGFRGYIDNITITD
jgi:hypothetical protein